MTCFDSYSAFEDWCEASGYDPDFHDEEEEPYKREVQGSGYILHSATDTYAFVTWLSHYDYGMSNIEVQKTGLHKVQRQVTKTVTTYE